MWLWERRLKPFRQVISEMAFAATGVNDEHAMAHLWNHGIKKYGKKHHDKPELIHKDIDSAKKDKNHPLHHSNFHSSGFVNNNPHGKEEAYYKELHSSVAGYHALATHHKLTKRHAEKHHMEVSGSGRGELSDLWKKHKAGNATSKADLVIRHPKNSKDHHGISVKKGPSQIMSGHHSEWAATAEAASKHAGHNSHQHSEVMDHVHKMGKLAHGFENKSPMERGKRIAKIKHMHDELHKKFPHLAAHITHEASTGEQKFKSDEGRAHMILHHGSGGAHVTDLTSKKMPHIVSKHRVSLKSHGSLKDSKGRHILDKHGNKIPGKQSVSYRIDTA